MGLLLPGSLSLRTSGRLFLLFVVFLLRVDAPDVALIPGAA